MPNMPVTSNTSNTSNAPARLPPVRELFIPSDNYIIADIDLDRADLQVAVWEWDDRDLKRRLRLGVDLHICNGLEMLNIPMPPEDELIETHQNYLEHRARYAAERKAAKSFVHGTNYGGSARTMARACGITIRQAELQQKRWFAQHPNIKQYHKHIELQLAKTRTVHNAFGFRRFYFGRVESLLSEALAWIPQSTVAHTINTGIRNLHHTLFGQVDLLLQVHDSAVLQWPITDDKRLRPLIQKCFRVQIPYNDPLVIPCGIKTSLKSWGACKRDKWENSFGEATNELA